MKASEPECMDPDLAPLVRRLAEASAALAARLRALRDREGGGG